MGRRQESMKRTSKAPFLLEVYSIAITQFTTTTKPHSTEQREEAARLCALAVELSDSPTLWVGRAVEAWTWTLEDDGRMDGWMANGHGWWGFYTQHNGRWIFFIIRASQKVNLPHLVSLGSQ
jgi:hypothetical protein